jgi:hypothetical protein
LVCEPEDAALYGEVQRGERRVAHLDNVSFELRLGRCRRRRRLEGLVPRLLFGVNGKRKSARLLRLFATRRHRVGCAGSQTKRTQEGEVEHGTHLAPRQRERSFLRGSPHGRVYHGFRRVLLFFLGASLSREVLGYSAPSRAGLHALPCNSRGHP